LAIEKKYLPTSKATGPQEKIIFLFFH